MSGGLVLYYIPWQVHEYKFVSPVKAVVSPEADFGDLAVVVGSQFVPPIHPSHLRFWEPVDFLPLVGADRVLRRRTRSSTPDGIATLIKPNQLVQSFLDFDDRDRQIDDERVHLILEIAEERSRHNERRKRSRGRGCCS